MTLRAPAQTPTSFLWPALEIGFWPTFFLFNAVANSLTVWWDVRKLELGFAAWEPILWETSSALAFLVVVPGVVWFTRRFPLHVDTWRRHLPWHVLGSVVFSLLHVGLMVLLRKLAYAAQGSTYEFGPLPQELLYEYAKDFRSYLFVVSVIEIYRLLRRRLQGEARLLDLPDEGPPIEPVDRPERFLVRKLGREFLVAATDIEWLQASGNYVNLRVRGHDYPLRSTLASLESRLDPASFARIHRSYAVNLGQVVSIEPSDGGDARVHLRDGSVLPCSRRYREALRGRAVGA